MNNKQKNKLIESISNLYGTSVTEETVIELVKEVFTQSFDYIPEFDVDKDDFFLDGVYKYNNADFHTAEISIPGHIGVIQVYGDTQDSTYKRAKFLLDLIKGNTKHDK